MKSIAIIGKNFGDEGKGLACAFFAKNGGKTLIIKHNGGGQAGHTVEDEKGRRFIHHQIGSGAEYGADTLLSDTFLADLYQLGNELQEFKRIYGYAPRIHAEKGTRITIIDDVLRNMFIESSRGAGRHGSCGMGINECVNRLESGYSLTIKDVQDRSSEELIGILQDFRKNYGQKNIDEIKREFVQNNPGMEPEYYEMLTNSDVLENFVECIKENVKLITLVDVSEEYLTAYDQVIFETGQGLLLDNDYKPYAPFLTPSKTGLWNIARFLDNRKLPLDEVVYVTRSYVTRHGNGPLPHECNISEIPGISKDLTNIDNQWQGSIRYARHGNINDFVTPLNDDVAAVNQFKSIKSTRISLLITHLNETDDKIYFADQEIPFDSLKTRLLKDFGFYKIYGSRNRYL